MEEMIICAAKKFSEDIGMKFGLDKCVKPTFIRGRLTSTSEVSLVTQKEEEPPFSYKRKPKV